MLFVPAVPAVPDFPNLLAVLAVPAVPDFPNLPAVVPKFLVLAVVAPNSLRYVNRLNNEDL
jgi:hypothetical protein